MSKEISSTEQSPERREPRYPCYGVQQAFRLSDAVRELGGGRVEVSKAILAKKLKAKESGAFSQLLGAAKCFRMIEGFKSYKLTDIALRYFHPRSDADRRAAEIESFESPLAFRVLIERFDGEQLPGSEHLGNFLLHDADVPGSWAQRVASIFISSAKDLGLIDDAGILRVAGSKCPSPQPPGDARAIAPGTFGMSPGFMSPPSAPPGGIPQASGTMQPQPTPPRPSADANVWTYTVAGKTVRLETPTEMPRALWEVLDRYVDILKPTEAEKGNL